MSYEPFEDPVETETPESPLIVAPPTSLPESTPPTLVPILRRTARMAVCVPPAMSPGLSASMAEVAAMSESVFHKSFRSSYKSSPSSSPPDIPSRKRYQGMSKLVEDDEEEDDEEDDDEEDEEIEKSLDYDSMSKDAEDGGPSVEDEDPVVRDEGLAAGDKGPSMGVESHGLDDEGHIMSTPLRLGYGALRRRELALEEDHVYSTFEVGQDSGSVPEPERPERVSASRQPSLTTWTDPKDGMVYIDVHAYPPPAPPVQTPPLPEWSSGLLPISPSPSIIPLPISSPMIPLTVPSPVDTPATAKTKGFLTELGAQVEMQEGLIRDHVVRLEELSPALFERYDRNIGELFTRLRAVRDEIFSQRYRFRSQTNAQRAALWHAISDTQGESWELRLQLTEERRARLKLAEIVDSMRRG
ncbi:hypothetical protein Tco_1370987 [Tanacetum coccineum]